MVDLLVQNGADLELANKFGNTPAGILAKSALQTLLTEDKEGI